MLNEFIDALQGALQGATRDLIKELETQGHRNTGDLAQSFNVDIKLVGKTVVGEVSGNFYLDYVNRRTHHQRITGGQLTGLTKYFTDKGLSGKELQNAVWGTARKQVEEGSPTRASYRFSGNGLRTGAIERTFGSIENNLSTELGRALSATITAEFTPVLNRELKTV